jgi:O-antigen/teichoic acid export membrane protein
MSIKNLVTNKSNTHQALWIAVGGLSSFALSIVSAAILSRYFDKSEYGTYRQILYVYTTLLVIFTAGLPRVFAYYLPRYTLAQGKDIIWNVTKVLLLAGLLFSAFLFLFSGLIGNALGNPELSKGLKCFSPVPLLLLPTLGIEGILSTYKKAVLIAAYNFLTRLLSLVCIVFPVLLFEGNYLYAIYGWISASVLTLVIAYFFKGIPFKGIESEKSGLGIKEILAYSVPLSIASVAGIAIKAADQFYISRYFGSEVFAEFANGFIELPFALMITSAVATVVMPVFSKMVNEKADLNLISTLWHSSLQKSAILIYPLVVFFMVFANKVMVLLYSSKYETSSVFFIISMTSSFFNVIVFAPLLFALGETKFYARLHFWIAMSAWVLGYCVVVLFNSPIAVAIFSTLQSILVVIASLVFTSKRIGIKFLKLFPIGRLLAIGIHSLLSVVFVFLILDNFFMALNNLMFITVAFVLFILVLLLLSPIFKISYLNIVRPIFYSAMKL